MEMVQTQTEKSTSLPAQLAEIYAAEILLIRAGQHLFKQWRDEGKVDTSLEASFECIWQLKREIRADKAALLLADSRRSR